MSSYAWGEAQSARTLALVGFIFFAIFLAIWGLVTLFMLASLAFDFRPGIFWPFPLFFPFGVFLALNAVLTVWSLNTMRDIDSGRYVQAQTSSLVLGILGLFANIISGILFLVVYFKLGNAVRYAQAPPPAYATSPTAATGRFCVECGRSVAVDAKFCSYCGKELGS